MNLSCRSSHQKCSLKKVFLKNFTKFSGKYLCWSLFFNKVSGMRPTTLLKMILQQRCFPVNFVKCLRTLFLQNTSRQLPYFVIHLTVLFCKKVLYIYSNLLLLEKSTKTHSHSVLRKSNASLSNLIYSHHFLNENVDNILSLSYLALSQEFSFLH